MKKIDWNNIRLIAMLGVAVFLYSFSAYRNENRNVKQQEIVFAETQTFITKEEVNKLLKQNFGTLTSVKKVQLDLGKVEKSICENPMVGRAEVYATVDGKLVAEITQKKPVARIFEGNKSYYLDYEGNVMPLSENETARVPLLTGNLKAVEAKRLTKLLKYIYDDNFLKKNITGLEVHPEGNIVMGARGYDFDIVFGSPINIDRKFDNYKAFLQDAIKDTLTEKYKTINLKFTQQVVCTKKQ
ncbi:MAG: cell division protein FtsQ/DivIB [Bacteroidia bacterium]|jgi:cell division protein FtsQ